MDRRKFLKASVVLVPGMAGCSFPVAYDAGRYGRLRSLAIVDLPPEDLGFHAQISQSSSMFSDAGANASMGGRLRGALLERTKSFHKEMRAEMRRDFASRGIDTTEIAKTSIENGTAESRETPVLSTQAILYFSALRDGLAPGAATISVLKGPDGSIGYKRHVAVGPPVAIPFTTFVAGPTDRFKDFKELLAEPERAAQSLMRIAAPLGSMTAAVIAKDLLGDKSPK